MEGDIKTGFKKEILARWAWPKTHLSQGQAFGNLLPSQDGEKLVQAWLYRFGPFLQERQVLWWVLLCRWCTRRCRHLCCGDAPFNHYARIAAIIAIVHTRTHEL